MGRKFTIFALFYFVFEGKFQVQAPRGAYIWRGDLTEGFLRYDSGGIIHGGAFFRNFTVFVLVIFAGITLKQENFGPTVSSFNPCLSLPSVATVNRKQFHAHKTGPVFLEFN